MPESLKKKTLKGTLWSAAERFSYQSVGFLVMIIMARILSPDDYGLIAELTVFIAVSQSLVDSGFSQALIRKLDRTETDNSTAFYFNIVVGLLLYLLLFICAPLIADFYEEPILTPLMRVIGLSLPLNSLVVVQRALFTIDIDFKTQAKATVTGAVVSGIIGIYMSYAGYGVWAIAGYQVSNLCVATLMFWILSKWRPSWTYSWKSFRELFSFGSKIAISGVLETLYHNIYLIVIGKTFRTADLGYYTRAAQFGDFPSSNITGIIQRVTFPILCTIQDDDERLRSVYRRFLRLSAFIVFPLMLGLGAVAQPLIVVILKDKWEFAAILLQILVFSMMWYPIHSINLNLLQVKGRSDLFLKLEIVKKAVGIAILCATLPLGLIVMCYGQILSSVLCLTINTYYTGKLINVGFIKQMRDLTPSLAYSLSMWGIVLMTVILTPGENIIKLLLGIAVGVTYFLVITALTKSRDRRELLAFVRGK